MAKRTTNFKFMKLKYLLLMCVLMLANTAAKAQDVVQDVVYYDISPEPATELEEGHVYMLLNSSYGDVFLKVGHNSSPAYDYVDAEEVDPSFFFDYPHVYQEGLFFVAGTDGISLPGVSLTYYHAENRPLRSGRKQVPSVSTDVPVVEKPKETGPFHVKIGGGQYLMIDYSYDKNTHLFYGVEPDDSESSQHVTLWEAHEVTEHLQHKWNTDCWSHQCNCGERAEHEVVDCKCIVCGYEHHSWDNGVCQDCHTACQHTDLEYVEAREATCESMGNIEHYMCSDCGLHFADADGKERLTREDVYNKDALGHAYDEDQACCTTCGIHINVAGDFTLDEECHVTMTNRNEAPDPILSGSCLYRVVPKTTNMELWNQLSCEGCSVTILDEKFRYYTDRYLDYTDYLTTLSDSSAYYLMFTFYDEDAEMTTKDVNVHLYLQGGDCVHDWVYDTYDEGASDEHYCSLCGESGWHNTSGEDGQCDVCGYQCLSHNFFLSYEKSLQATLEALEAGEGKPVSVYECYYCHYQMTEAVDPEAKCPNGGSHDWYSGDEREATCTQHGYTVMNCNYCDAAYICNITDINPDNHYWSVYEDEYDGNIISQHICNYGCEAHSDWEDHTMEDGKCTVCGYWPGHTEHQWERNSWGHYCTIPGCRYDGWDDHELDENCLCLVCGFEYHEYYKGVCERCGKPCDHIHWELASKDPDCVYDGISEHYECHDCGAYVTADGQSMTDDEVCALYVPSLGHLLNEQGQCTRCHDELQLAGELAWGETREVVCHPDDNEDFWPENALSQSVYKLEVKEGAALQLACYEPDMEACDIYYYFYSCVPGEDGTKVFNDGVYSINYPLNVQPGTYYVAFYCGNYDGDEPLMPAMTYSPVICLPTDDYYSTVELAANAEGQYAATGGMVFDADHVFKTPVDFTATTDQVVVARGFEDNTPSTISLPFDIETEDITGTFYTFDGIDKDAETGKWVATMKEATGSLKAHTPYIALTQEEDRTSDGFIQLLGGATLTFRADDSQCSTTCGDWQMVSSLYDKVWNAENNADELGRVYGFAAQSQTNGAGEEIEKGQFVKAAAGARIKARHAYLLYKDDSNPLASAQQRVRQQNNNLPGTISVRFVNADGTTGLSDLDAQTGRMQPVQWYDLSGRKMQQPAQRGLYIKNNKKTVVR